MMYYATLVFFLLNGTEEHAMSTPVGGPQTECIKVLQYMAAQRIAKYDVKGYRPACVLGPTPK